MNQIHNWVNVSVIEEMRLLSLPEDLRTITANDHQLIYILEGRLEIKSTLYNGIIHTGNMVVLPSGTEPISFIPITEPISAYCIRFTSASVSRSAGSWSIIDALPSISGIVRVQSIPVTRHKFEQIHRLWKESLSFTNPLHIAWLELWESIRSEMILEEPNLESKLQHIVNHMDLHYEEEFQVEDMARHSGVTPTIFFKRFKVSTSQSPLQYITRIRIEQARNLLVEGEAPIREVAHTVGYSDVYYFRRIFKKVIGIPPYRYRQLLQRKIAVLNPPLFDDLLALGVPRDKLIPFWNREDQKKTYRDHDTYGMELLWLRRERPELIIGTDNLKPMYDQLSDIAPTHLIQYKPFSWREHLREIATILDVSEVAEYWLYYYEQKAAAVRNRIHRRLGDQTVLVALVQDRNIRVCGANRRKIGRFLYGDLKLNAPLGTDRFAFSDIESLTELNKFRADHILLLGDQTFQKATSLSISGQVHHAGLYPWLHYSALGHERSMEEALLYFSPE